MGELTLTTIWAAIASVGVIMLLFSKWIEGVFGVKLFPAIKKGWGYFQRQWFKDAIFKKELGDWMIAQKETLNEVKAQLHRNGGSTLKDAVTRLEDGQKELKVLIHNNKAVREISDMYSGQMIFRMDGEGSCIFINDAFLKFFGWAENDVLAFGFENLLHDDDVKECRVKWQMAITRHSKFFDEQRISDHNGTYHLCHVKAAPIMLEGVIMSFYGTIEVVNERS